MVRRTTSAARTSKRPAAGFTLFEIVIVLLVIALVAGSAIGMMIMSADERALSRASVEVESLAKRARTIASLQQRPYALEFFENRVSMMSLAEASVEPRDRERAAEMLAASGEEGGGTSFDTVRGGWELDPEMQMFVRRWSSETWLPVDSKNRQVWRFDPEGFCEPIGVRWVIGESWLEADFHPLTGSIRESASEIY